MSRPVGGVVHGHASAEVAYHGFEEAEVPVIRTGWKDGHNYSTTHVTPLTWEAAETLYKDLARIFGEKEVMERDEWVERSRQGWPVIVGYNTVEARYWKGEFARQVPELADAEVVSAFDARYVEGMRVRKVFIAPGAEKAPSFEYVLEVLQRNLHMIKDSDKDIVRLAEREVA